MQKWQQWESASEADWGLAVEREAVIRPLAEQQKLRVEDVEAAVRHLRIGRSVLYNLVHRYRQRTPDFIASSLEEGGETVAFRIIWRNVSELSGVVSALRRNASQTEAATNMAAIHKQNQIFTPIVGATLGSREGTLVLPRRFV